MELTDTQRKRIVNNVRKVFLTKSIDALNKQAYEFIILRMGFIAHYDLYGFRATYDDLREFAHHLRTSEYSNDPGYQFRGLAHMSPNDAQALREIVRIAEVFEPQIELRMLAEKHGFSLL